MSKTQGQPCLNCVAPMTVRRETVQVIGLPSVRVRGVEVSQCRACGAREVAFSRIDDLHRAIAEALVVKRQAIVGSELRFLRGVMGRSTEELARDLDVAAATLSRWENGRQAISPSLDRLARFTAIARLHLTPERPEAILRSEPGAAEPLELVATFDGMAWKTKAAQMAHA